MPFSQKRNITLLLSGMLLLPLLSCSKPHVPEGYPEPGKMHVVGVTPLIVNKSTVFCDFSQWYPGAPVPRGFIAPNRDYSITERSVDKTTGGPVLRQTWLKSDRNTHLDNSLRILFDDLALGETYTLSLEFTQTAPGTVWVNAWEVSPDGKFNSVMVDKFIELEAEALNQFKEYTAEFKPGNSTKVIVATRGDEGAVVEWRNIRVIQSQ